MLSNSFFQESLKEVEKITKSKMAIFHLERTSGDQEDANTSIKQLVDVASTLHKLACYSKFNIEGPDVRYYTSSRSRPDAEFYTLTPMVFSGYSPFMIYKEEDGVRGLLVKIRKHRFVEDRSELKVAVDNFMKAQFRERNFLKRKEAESMVLAMHDFDFPLVEKISDSYLYIDVRRQNIYVSKSHRELDTVMVLFGCLKTIIDVTNSDPETAVKWPDHDVLFGARNVGALYTHYASAKRRTGGLYNIQKIVDFYAQADGAMIAEPTDSAKVYESENPTMNISFKNALSLMTNNSEAQGFSRLKNFSMEYNVTFSSLGLAIEIPVPSFVRTYLELTHETDLFSAEQTHIDCVFNTEDKHGNITFKLANTLDGISTALKTVYRESKDGITSKDEEINLLDHLAKMLWFLDEAAAAFIELYERASPPEEGEDEFTDALENANENTATTMSQSADNEVA